MTKHARAIEVSYFCITFPPFPRSAATESRALHKQLEGLLMRTPNHFKTRDAAEMVLSNLRLQGLDARAYVTEAMDVM